MPEDFDKEILLNTNSEFSSFILSTKSRKNDVVMHMKAIF